MEDLSLGTIAALVPECAVKDLPLGRTHDDDDESKNTSWLFEFFAFIHRNKNVRIDTVFHTFSFGSAFYSP